jgi:hypothetical protein
MFQLQVSVLGRRIVIVRLDSYEVKIRLMPYHNFMRAKLYLSVFVCAVLGMLNLRTDCLALNCVAAPICALLYGQSAPESVVL